MEQALRAAGCRITRQRSAILEYLAAMDAHPSARQVYGEVKGTVPDVSLATVYNTLGKLARMRLIKLIDFEASDNRYDKDPEPHVNLICTVCGRIQDFERGLPVALEAVRVQAGFEVQDVRMEYYGKCAECRTRAGPGAGNLRAKGRKAWRRRRT
jgi:Fur family transcriptional regulator, peroxide stress response regulator